MNRNDFVGTLSSLTSLPKVAILRLRGVRFLGGNVRIFGWPKIRQPKQVVIGGNVTLGRFVRIEGAVQLGEGVFVNEFSMIGGSDEAPVTIGQNTSIAPGCYIISSDHSIAPGVAINQKGKDLGGKKAAIAIGSNCWLGAHAIVLKGVTLGDGVVVGAGSVVTKSAPQDSVIAGNPATVIRSRAA